MKAILACDTHGGIGYKNKLPWKNLQGDLPRFKALTTGQPIVMGKNTWDSLPFKPLPNRLNIVVSSTMQPTDGRSKGGGYKIGEPNGSSRIKSLCEVLQTLFLLFWKNPFCL